MNGYASNIRVTLHKDGSSITIEDDGRGIPVDVHPKTKKTRARGDLHGAPCGRQVRDAAITRPPAGSTASARASSTRCRASWSPPSSATATSGRCGSSRASRLGRLKKLGAARGTGTTVFFHPDPDDLPEDRIRRRRSSATASRSPATCIAASRSSFDDETTGTQDRVSTRRRPGRLPEEDRRASAARKPVHEAPFVLQKDNGVQGRARAAVDRSDRRAPAQLRQRHSDRFRRHARKRLARRARQGRPQLHRDAQPDAEGRDADRGGHPRRHDRRAVGLHSGAAISGADQGSAEQSRAAVGGRRHGAAGARALAESQPVHRRSDRRAHHPRRARARGEPRGAAGSRPQGADLRSRHAARASSPIARIPARSRASSSSSKAIRRAGRRSRAAIARVRRSCRCAAR